MITQADRDRAASDHAEAVKHRDRARELGLNTRPSFDPEVAKAWAAQGEIEGQWKRHGGAGQ